MNNTEVATSAVPARKLPAKKVPAKKLPSGATAPAARPVAGQKAPTAAPAPAAKKAAKPVAAPKEVSTETGDGRYPWLFNRVRAALIASAPDGVREDIRDGLKGVTSFTKALTVARKNGFLVEEVALIKFLDKTIAEGYTIKGGREKDA